LAHPAAAFTKSPPGSAVALLERAVLHGQDREDPDSMLLSALEKKACEYVTGLRQYVDGELARIEERAALLIQQINS
jgi:hypothetical protein